MSTPRRIRTRALAVSVVIGTVLGAACQTTGARSPETEAALETFYADWEAQIVEEMARLDAGDVARLRDVWPRAGFEGATRDVLDVIAEEATLRPFVRRLRRFLQNYPSNAVHYEMRTETVDRRMWHILVDTVNAELRERPL